MFNHKIPSRRLAVWVPAALILPIAARYSGLSWTMVLLTGLICGIISGSCLKFCDEQAGGGRWVCLLQLVWIILFLGMIVPYSATCWEDGSAYPAVPLTLLALSAFSACSGGEKASRVSAVLILALIPILGLVLCAGANTLEISRMAPSAELAFSEVIPLFLLPTVTVFLPRENSKYHLAIPITIAFAATILALWINASISPAMAQTAADPLYEYSKSISLFGITQRFESLVSCGMTLAWFAMVSLVLTAAGHLAEKIKKGWGSISVWLCAASAAVAVMYKLPIPTVVYGILSLIFWGFLPLLTQGIVLRKKMKKTEK